MFGRLLERSCNMVAPWMVWLSQAKATQLILGQAMDIFLRTHEKVDPMDPMGGHRHNKACQRRSCTWTSRDSSMPWGGHETRWYCGWQCGFFWRQISRVCRRQISRALQVWIAGQICVWSLECRRVFPRNCTTQLCGLRSSQKVYSNFRSSARFSVG